MTKENKTTISFRGNRLFVIGIPVLHRKSARLQSTPRKMTIRLGLIAVIFCIAIAATVSVMAQTVRLVEPANNATVSQLKPCQLAYFDARKAWDANEQVDWDTVFNISPRSNSPKEVEFRWTSPVGAKNSLEIAENSQFDHVKTVDAGSEMSASVQNFRLGQQYYWRVRSDLDGKVTLSDVFSFITDRHVPRFLKIQGAFNVRDMGGWKVRGGCIRQGLVLRGSSLDSVNTQGCETLLHDFGIKVDIDLRGDADRYDSPLGPTVCWQNHPVSCYEEIGTDAQTKESYRKIFQLLAEKKNYPLYFHCAGGADRAGTLAIVMEAVLGMNALDIWSDYELTVFSHGTGWGSNAHQRYGATLKQLGIDSNGENFEEKVVQYLLEIGVTQDELDHFRDIMIEPDVK